MPPLALVEMRRERVVEGAVAAALVYLAFIVALPFRADALAKTPLFGLGWDAALHATEGLDLFDDLRLLRPLDALSLLASRHWWGPLWALVSAPFQAAFGPSLAAASLPSLIAFALAPTTAFLLVRRISPGGSLASVASGALVAVLFLRSPMLLETSAWPMLESLGGFLALFAWLFFARREERGARRVAFLSGAALFLLKCHFGFFVLGTFGAVVVVEETVEARRRLSKAVRDVFLGAAGAAILALAVVLGPLRAILEADGRATVVRFLPSASNVLWGAFLLMAVLGIARRRALEDASRGSSAVFRDFLLFGALPPFVWCLDPANVRGWYRQIFQPTDAPRRSLFAMLAAFPAFLRDDYVLGAAGLCLVFAGLVLAISLRGDRTRRALAAFILWPVVLMSLNRYPSEARFLACLAPCLFVAAVAGLRAGIARLGPKAREPGFAALAIVLVLSLDPVRWSDECERRAPFRYAHGPAGAGAVEAAVAASPPDGPVSLTLPALPPVWPTVRLALRLSRRDLAPRFVNVAAGPQ
jgi:hypothetical protein